MSEIVNIIETNENASVFSGPLFLIGMPRSGTKLLRDLLNQHPQISIPSIETEFLPGLAKKYSVQHEFDKTEFSHLYNEVLKFPYFKYLAEFNKSVREDEWFSACGNYTLSGIFEALIRLSTNTINNKDVIWGDKSPSYIDHVSVLKEIYPSAKFIHIVRDVRDYVLSMSNAWGKNKLRAAQRWADSLDKIRDDVIPFQQDVFVLKYEDLLDESEATLRDILDFIDLPFNENVLQLSSASENLGDTKGETKIISGNKGKYTSILSDKEISKIEQLAGCTLTSYGYSVSYSGDRQRLSLLKEKFYQFLDAFNLIMFEKKERGIWGSVYFYWNYFRATRGI